MKDLGRDTGIAVRHLQPGRSWLTFVQPPTVRVWASVNFFIFRLDYSRMSRFSSRVESRSLCIAWAIPWPAYRDPP